MFTKLVDDFFEDIFGGKDWGKDNRWRVMVFAEWLDEHFVETKLTLDAKCNHAYTHDTQPSDYRFCPWCGGKHDEKNKKTLAG